MDQHLNEYYLFFKNWSMDPNQWSMLLDSTAVLLTLVGFLFALILYHKQRRDNAHEAFDFFQSSLPELKQSIIETIENLTELHRNLGSDSLVNPVLSPTLNDRFLTKINLVHLNRFYKKYRKGEHAIFQDFLVDSNFFGDYHSYFIKEINYFRTSYNKKKRNYDKWQLLRSDNFFSTDDTGHENSDFKNFYTKWAKQLNQDRAVFQFNAQGQPTQIKNRRKLIENHIEKLVQNTFAFLPFSNRANEAHMIAKKVLSAHTDMSKMEVRISGVLEKDLKKFEEVLVNLNGLLEEKLQNAKQTY